MDSAPEISFPAITIAKADSMSLWEKLDKEFPSAGLSLEILDILQKNKVLRF